MKKIIPIIAMLVISHAGSNAQDNNGEQFIKLFITSSSIASNNRHLDTILQQRLYNKMVQLINQSGIADIGFSNFLVVPKLDVMEESVSKAGIQDVHLARCEFFITVSRTDFDLMGGAVYASYSRQITGSGSTGKQALANAINNINGRDKNIDSFFKTTKAKIFEYYNTNCDKILAEAAQAAELNDYARSIAIYFSIPSTAHCYKSAHDASVLVFRKYHQNKCEKQILHLKSLVAQIQSNNRASIAAYKEVLNIIEDLSPSYQIAPQCYALAQREIEKIETRFSDAQKREWELIKKRTADIGEFEKEMAKSMGKMSITYQPEQKKSESSNNVIIVK